MKTTDSLLRGINFLIKRAIQNAPFDYSEIGIVTTVLGNNLYNVKISDKTYKLYSVYSDPFSVGQTVVVRFPQNNVNLAYVESKAPDLSYISE